MAFVNTKNSRVFLNATHQSGQISGYTIAHSREYSTATTFLDSGTRWVPGLLSVSTNIKGYCDSSAATLYATALAVFGTANGALWTVFPDLATIDQPAMIVNSNIQGFDVPASVKDTVSLNIDAMPDDGVDMGVSLHDHTAETADGNGASVNNLAATTNGGVASLHVTAFSGLTNNIIKVQHSTDNSIWTDLVTFTTVTGPTFQRSTVAGTVNQYLRAFWDVTGSGTNTFVVAFARR